MSHDREPNVPDINQLQTGLTNLASYVAAQTLRDLMKEADELIALIGTASIEDQERIKRIAIKVAISTVSVAVGAALATATGGIAHPLLHLVSTQLMHEIATLNVNASLDQMLMFVNEKANEKINALAAEAKAEGAALIKQKHDQKALEALMSVSGSPDEKTLKSAAQQILHGQGEKIVTDFYDELRKNPEAICFIRGRAAKIPPDAFKNLTKYGIFEDFESIKGQAKKFENVSNNNLNTDKMSDIFRHDEDAQQYYLRRNIPETHELKNHIRNMSNLMGFIFAGKAIIPDNVLIKKFTPDPFFEKWQIIAKKCLQNKDNGISKTDLDILLRGLNEIQKIMQDNFVNSYNKAVHDVNVSAIREVQGLPLFPYLIPSEKEVRKEAIQYLVKEAYIRRSATDKFNLESFSQYMANVIQDKEKTQKSAIKAMDAQQYVKVIERKDLKDNVDELLKEVEKLKEDSKSGKHGAFKIDSQLSDKLSSLQENIQKKAKPTDKDLMEVAALAVRIINTSNFEIQGNSAVRKPYPITSKEKIPTYVTEQMQLEVYGCESVITKKAVAAKSAVEIAAQKAAEKAALDKDVSDKATKEKATAEKNHLEQYNHLMEAMQELRGKYDKLNGEFKTCKDPERKKELKEEIEINISQMRYMMGLAKVATTDLPNKISIENINKIPVKDTEKWEKIMKSQGELFKNLDAPKSNGRGKIFGKIADKYNELRRESYKKNEQTNQRSQNEALETTNTPKNRNP